MGSAYIATSNVARAAPTPPPTRRIHSQRAYDFHPSLRATISVAHGRLSGIIVRHESYRPFIWHSAASTTQTACARRRSGAYLRNQRAHDLPRYARAARDRRTDRIAPWRGI